MKTILTVTTAFLLLSIAQLTYAETAIKDKRILITPTASPQNIVMQKASHKLTSRFSKEVTKETPDVFVKLVKTLESDKEFALKLTKAVSQKQTKQVNELLAKVTKSKLDISYSGSTPQATLLKLCAYRNGVKHCFPSMRNSPKDPTF